MALHLNLIHEIDKLKRAQKRDPLKLSLWGLGVIASGFAAYYFFQVAKLSMLAQEFAKKNGLKV